MDEVKKRKRGRPAAWTGFHKGSLSSRIVEWADKLPNPFTSAECAKHFGLNSSRASALICQLVLRGHLDRHDKAEGRGMWAFWISSKVRKEKEWQKERKSALQSAKQFQN